MMGGATDPAAQGAAPDDSASQDYCIEVTVKGGAISVSVEPLDEESQEEAAAPDAQDGSAPEADDTGTPVRNAKEAARIVADIINNGGQLPDPSQPSMEQSSAADAFTANRGR
jgi:hypothetical protein